MVERQRRTQVAGLSATLLLCLVVSIAVSGAMGEPSGQSAPASPEEVDLKSAAAVNARKRFALTVQDARLDYEAKYTKAAETLVAELRLAMKDATKRGDLEEALRIRSAIDAVEGVKAPVAPGADRAAGDVYLTGLLEKPLKAGKFDLARGSVIPNDRTIVVQGKRFPRGLGLHAADNAEVGVEYAIEGRFKRFSGGVAVNDTAVREGGTRTALTFRIVGDGRVLWKSRGVRTPNDVQEFSVSVARVRKLQLYVECPGDSWAGHAVWLDPRLR